MPLELTLRFARPTALVNGPIAAEVTATNTGDLPVEAPDPDVMSPYEFSLRDADGAGRYGLSAYGALAGRNQDSATEPEYANVTLDPGASVTSTFDLGELALDPVAPGRYSVAASWHSPGGYVTSPPAPLVVAQPSVLRLGAGWCPGDQCLSYAFASAEPGGGASVHQRSGREDYPLSGVTFPRDDVPPGARAVGVATAIGLQPVAETRWYAALVDRELHVGVAQRGYVFKRLAPLDLSLTNAALYELGWQTSSDLATFVALGLDAAGQLTLVAVTADANADAPIAASFPVGVAESPTAWCARCALRDEGRMIDLVLAFTGPQGASLYRVTLWPDTGASSGPSPITRYPEPVAALAFDPVASDLTGVVDVLFGPVGVEGRMTLARLALDGSGTVALSRFVAPYDVQRVRPRAWALAQATLDRPLVLAHLSPRVYALRAGDDATWVEVADGRPDAAFLHAFTPTDHPPFALWFDPARGVEVHPVEV